MLVGALAMFFALDVSFLVSLAGMPFVADSLCQAIIDVLPGWVSIPLIELLQYWAKWLLIVGVVALFFADGAITGLLAVAPRRRDATVVAVAVVPWVASVVLAQLFSASKIEPVTSVIDAAAGAATFLVSLAFVLPSAAAQAAAGDPERPPSPARRRALLGTAGLAALVAIAALPLSRISGIAASTFGNVPTAARRLRAKASVAAADPAIDVAFTSVDGYTDSFPIAKAMEARTLVAYLMNGRTIPQDHGYPARILVPNIYGMKNVKWVRKIEVVSYDFLGYWMQQGWSDSAVVNTNTRIDLPGRNARWDGGVLTIAGIAYAGARGISKVEVSTDGGSSWSAASLEPMAGDLSWRRWSFGWTPPKTGSHRLVARSTDGAGNTETPIRRPPFPNGSTGYHEVEVNVQRG